MRSLLHVGCGLATKAQLIPYFQTPDWRELRLDIDPAVKPDLVGTMTDLSAVASESIDAVYSSHNVEHLFPHEVPLAVGEFVRVLKPQGFALITCPDLQEVCRHVAEGRLLETLYVSPSGPIAALDVIYGFRGSTRTGNHFMAHRCGFTLNVLLQSLRDFGFKSAAGFSRPDQFALWAVARKDELTEAGIKEFTEAVFQT
jgi:SAM-dependent methyltransferase